VATCGVVDLCEAVYTTTRGSLTALAKRVPPLVSAVRRGRVEAARAKQLVAEISQPLWIGKYRVDYGRVLAGEGISPSR
jgi:hypothetical protein